MRTFLFTVGLVLLACALVPRARLEADGQTTLVRIGFPAPWLYVTGGNAGGNVQVRWRQWSAGLGLLGIVCVAGSRLIRTAPESTPAPPQMP